MASYDPPTIKSNIFNDSYFTDLNGNLTLEASDKRYIKKNNGYATGLLVDGLNIINSLTYNNALVDLSSISGVSAGVASANKALILDSGRNITGIQGICLGSSLDTSRYLSLLVDNINVGDTLYGLTYGYDSTNQAEFGYFYAGPNSSSNALTFGFYSNSNILRVNADQSVDIPYHDGVTTGLKLAGALITASATKLNYVDVLTLGSAEAEKALVLNSDKDISGMRHMSMTGNFIASTSMASPTLTTNSILTSTGTLGITYTTLNLNGISMTANADELNYNDITTLGVAQASKTLTMNSTGLLRIGAGTVAGSNQIKWFNNTSLRCSIRMYRASDTTPLIVADQIDLDRSTNRTYPILSVVSCPTTTGTTNGTPIGGISATTASLFNVKVNDAGFGTTNFDVGFSYGFTQPFASGYANVQTLTTDGDALNIVVGSSNGVANTGNLLIDGTNKRTVFNSLTPSQATHTLNGSIFCKGGTGWTSGTYEILGRFESSNGGNRVDVQCSTIAGDPCWIGTATNSQLRLGINNTTYMTVRQSQVGINTTNPRAPLEVSGTNNYKFGGDLGLETIYRLRTDNGNTESAASPITYAIGIYCNSYIAATALVMVSDKRLKTGFRDIDMDHVSKFYDSVKPQQYYYKNNKSKLEYGLIAQEIAKSGYPEMISMIPNDDLKGVIEDPETDIDGVQLLLNYQNVCIFNMKMIQNLIKEINILKDIVDKLVSKPALNKWLQRG